MEDMNTNNVDNNAETKSDKQGAKQDSQKNQVAKNGAASLNEDDFDIDDFDLNELADANPRTIKLVETFMMMAERHTEESEIGKKVTSEHIGAYLETARENMNREYEDRKHGRWFLLATLILVAVFMTIVIVLLKDNNDLLEDIITHVAAVAAGAFGGYGLGKTKRSE